MLMDITISRDMTINTGNYSSIKPAISVTLKDVKEEDFNVEYHRLSELADALIALETVRMGGEMSSISDMGFGAYLRTLEKSERAIQMEIEKFSEKK